MNLINTDIVPDPYDPQTGDVYEFGDPFVQRLVVEDAPTRDDPRVRYRIDGGVDSNLTTVAQFHRHLAGLTRIRGVGRVREFLPITAEVRKSLVHQLRSTALGVDPVAGDLMRGAATTIVEQAAALDGVACREALEQSKVRLALLQAAVAQALAEDIPDIDDAAATAGLVERLGLLIAALPEVYREREEAEARVVELKRELEVGADNLARLSTLLQTTCTRFAALADAVSPRRPSEDADLIHAATNARQIAYQVKFAIRLLGFEWDDSKADAGHALLQAVRAERKIASDLGMELDSISSMIAPLGVQIPAGFDGDRSTPTSLDLVRWLVVRSGIDLRSQRLTLPEVWEVRDSPTSAGHGANQFTRFKAIVDQLRLVASMEDSGNYNYVRSTEAMRTAAAAMRELMDILVRQLEVADRLRIVVGQGAIEASRLTDIINILWGAIEHVTGRNGLEHNLSNAAALKGELEALDPRQHHVKTLREQLANLETSLRACEADLNAIRSAYLDVNGTTATITEIVGSLRGSCEMQTRIMNLEAIVSDRESTIAMMAERRLIPSEPDDIKKVARVNALCPPGWHVAMARSGIAVFHPQEVVPRVTITGDSTARIVAEIWRWHMQPTVERLAEFQEGLADILGWSVPQLYDPSGARDMLTAVAGLIMAAKEAE